jgi:long-subunit acyl-CoA synthetase (AMP-forming)
VTIDVTPTIMSEGGIALPLCRSAVDKSVSINLTYVDAKQLITRNTRCQRFSKLKDNQVNSIDGLEVVKWLRTSCVSSHSPCATFSDMHCIEREIGIRLSKEHRVHPISIVSLCSVSGTARECFL